MHNVLQIGRGIVSGSWSLTKGQETNPQMTQIPILFSAFAQHVSVPSESADGIRRPLTVVDYPIC